MSKPNLDDTLEFPATRLGSGKSAFHAPAPVQVDYAALSHPGKLRPNNEDHFLVARFKRSLETLLTNLGQGRLPERLEEAGYGMLVADGMGGYAGGELASELAILSLVDLVFDTPDWLMSSAAADAVEVMQRMAKRYRRIDELLKERSEDDPRLTGMGTTMTMACSFGLRMVLAHIGDSRAYLLRGDRLHQLTRDHTMAQALVDSGVLQDVKDAATRLQHTLTRCLGGHGPSGDAIVQQLALADGDQVLLCSDGLSGMVDDAAIGAILRRATSAAAACQELIDAALSNGGTDNVTVALTRYRAS